MIGLGPQMFLALMSCAHRPCTTSMPNTKNPSTPADHCGLCSQHHVLLENCVLNCVNTIVCEGRVRRCLEREMAGDCNTGAKPWLHSTPRKWPRMVSSPQPSPSMALISHSDAPNTFVTSSTWWRKTPCALRRNSCDTCGETGKMVTDSEKFRMGKVLQFYFILGLLRSPLPF